GARAGAEATQETVATHPTLWGSETPSAHHNSFSGPGEAPTSTQEHYPNDHSDVTPALEHHHPLWRYTYTIRVLSAHGRFEEAWARVWLEMKRRKIPLDFEAYTAMLSGAALARDAETAEEVWADMSEAARVGAVVPGEHAWSARIHAHVRTGDMERALSVGEGMRDAGFPWDVVVYTSLMAGWVNKGETKRAWDLWKTMIYWGIKPDVMTYTTMIKACGKTGEYEKAMGLLSEMESMEGILPTVATFNCLIFAAAKAPMWIKGYRNVVDDLVQRMVGLGLEPQEETYRMLMYAYGRAGDADRVLQCLQEVHELSGYSDPASCIGDGSPKLSTSTYRNALEALAFCQSVGTKNGTKPRWGLLQGEEEEEEFGPIQVPLDTMKGLDMRRMQGMQWDEEAEKAFIRKSDKRVKFRGITTPKEVLEDPDFQEDISNEFRRAVAEAKAAEARKEQEDMIALGIGEFVCDYGQQS
ncbi:unnamed protein product, partial [Discosporangium mesarthrocarpum]